MRLISDMLGNLFQEEDLVYGPHPAPAGWQKSSSLGPSGSGDARALATELQPRAESGFAGLMNQGTTCYLNSLLQTMFMTPELRAGLYQVSAADLGMDVALPVADADQCSDQSSSGTGAGGEGEAHALADDGSGSGGDEGGGGARLIVMGEPAADCAEFAAPRPSSNSSDAGGQGLEREQTAAVTKEEGAGVSRGEEGNKNRRHDQRGGGKMSEDEAAIVAMGFSLKAVRKALARHRGYMLGAVHWLLDGGDSSGDSDDVEDSGEGGGMVRDQEGGVVGSGEVVPVSVVAIEGGCEDQRSDAAEIPASLSPEQPYTTAGPGAGGAGALNTAATLGEQETSRDACGGRIAGEARIDGGGDVNSLLWRVEMEGANERGRNGASVNDGDSACTDKRGQAMALVDVNVSAKRVKYRSHADDGGQNGEEDLPVSGKGSGRQVEKLAGEWRSSEGGVVEGEVNRLSQIDANSSQIVEARTSRDGEGEGKVSSRTGHRESGGGDCDRRGKSNGLVGEGALEGWMKEIAGGEGEGGGGADPGVATGAFYGTGREEAVEDNGKDEELESKNSMVVGDGPERLSGGVAAGLSGEGGIGRKQGQTNNLSSNSRPKRKVRRGLAELQKLFAWLQAVDQRAFSTEALTRSFGWDGGEAREQHDVHELNRLLFDAIEHSLKGTPQEQLIADLYHGKLVNQVECLKCGNVSEREEAFSDIPVVVKGFSSLEESMAAAAQAEVLQGDNQYFCERCQCKVDARRSQRLRSLPPVLTLPLCRFEYDWENDERRKISSHFSFPLLLDLAPYVADLHAEHGSIDVWAKSNTLQGEVEGDQGEKSCSVRGKMMSEALEIGEKEELFCGDSYKYDLLSVVIHSGNAHSGHYHAYIRDLFKSGKTSMTTRASDVSALDIKPSDMGNIVWGSTGGDGHEGQESSIGGVDEGQHKGRCGDNLCGELGPTPESEKGLARDRKIGGDAMLDVFKMVNTEEECFCSWCGGKEMKVCTRFPRDYTQKQGLELSERGTVRSGKGEVSEWIQLEEQQQAAFEDGQLWYDFNDSSVTRMTGFAIEKQFGGSNECAYMLTYRARALPAGRPCQVDDKDCLVEQCALMDDEPLGNGFVGPGHVLQYGQDAGTTCSGKTRGRHTLMGPAALEKAVQLPPHLQSLVDKANEDLKHEWELAELAARQEAVRVEAEAAAARMRLTVHLPGTCIIGGGYLANKPEDSSGTERVLVLEKKSTVGQLATVISAQFSKWLGVPDKSRMMLYVVSPPKCAPRGVAQGLLPASLFLKPKSAVVLRDVDGESDRDGSTGGLHVNEDGGCERRVDTIDDIEDTTLSGNAAGTREVEYGTTKASLSSAGDVALLQAEKEERFAAECCNRPESNEDVTVQEQMEGRVEGTLEHTRGSAIGEGDLDSAVGKETACNAVADGVATIEHVDSDGLDQTEVGVKEVIPEVEDLVEKGTWGLRSTVEEEGNEDVGKSDQFEVTSIASSAGSSKREESDSGAGFMDEESPGGESEAVTLVCQILGALPTFRVAARLVDVGFVDGGGVLPWDREWGPLECYEDRTRLVGINMGTMKSPHTLNGEERLGQPVGWSSRLDSTALGQVNHSGAYEVFVKDCTQGDPSSSWGQIRNDQLLTVMVCPDMAICELKRMALQQREQSEGCTSPAESTVILRRTTAGGAPAEALSQEFRTLKTAGIGRGQLVIMEVSMPCISTEASVDPSFQGYIHLQLTVMDRNSAIVLDREPVEVEKWCTVGDCKGLLTATALGKAKWPLPPQLSQGMDFVLLKSDWSGTKGEMITAADNVDIDAVGIKDGDLVWLQEVTSPDLEQITVKVFRYFLPHEMPGKLVDGAVLRSTSQHELPQLSTMGDGPMGKDGKTNLSLSLDLQSISSAPTPASSPTAGKERANEMNTLEGPPFESTMHNCCLLDKCTRDDKEPSQTVPEEESGNLCWSEDEDMRHALALSMEDSRLQEEADGGAIRPNLAENKKDTTYSNVDVILMEPGIPASCIHFVRELAVSKEMKLRELKRRIGELAEFRAQLEARNGILRVREIIQGRLVKEFRQDDKILRQMHIGDGRALAVRIVPREEAVKWMASELCSQLQLPQVESEFSSADNTAAGGSHRDVGSPTVYKGSIASLGLDLWDAGCSADADVKGTAEVQIVSPHAFLLCVHRRVLLPGNNVATSARATGTQTKEEEPTLEPNTVEANGMGRAALKGVAPEGGEVMIPVNSVSCAPIPFVTCGLSSSTLPVGGIGSGQESYGSIIPSVVEGVSDSSPSDDLKQEGICFQIVSKNADRSDGLSPRDDFPLPSPSQLPPPNLLDPVSACYNLTGGGLEINMPTEGSCQQLISSPLVSSTVPEKTVKLPSASSKHPSVAAMAVCALAAGVVTQQAMLLESWQSAAGLMPLGTADNNAETPKSSRQHNSWTTGDGKLSSEQAAMPLAYTKGTITSRAALQIPSLPFSPLKPVAATVQPPPLRLHPPSLPMPNPHSSLPTPSMGVPVFQCLPADTPLPLSNPTPMMVKKGGTLPMPVTSSLSVITSACETTTQPFVVPLSWSSASISGAMVAPSLGYVGGSEPQLQTEAAGSSISGSVDTAVKGEIPHPPPLPVGHGRQLFGFLSPQEVIFDPKVASVPASMLQKFLSGLFQIPVERLKVAKLFKNGIWKMLPDDPSTQEPKPPSISTPAVEQSVNCGHGDGAKSPVVSHPASGQATEKINGMLNEDASQRKITAGSDAILEVAIESNRSVSGKVEQVSGGILVHGRGESNLSWMEGEQSIMDSNQSLQFVPEAPADRGVVDCHPGGGTELINTLLNKNGSQADVLESHVVKAWSESHVVKASSELCTRREDSIALCGSPEHGKRPEKAPHADSVSHHLATGVEGMGYGDWRHVQGCEEQQLSDKKNKSRCVTYSGVDSVVNAGEGDEKSSGAVSLELTMQSGDSTPLTGGMSQGGSDRNKSGSTTPLTEGCLQGSMGFGLARGKSSGGLLSAPRDMNESGSSTPLRGEMLHTSLASDTCDSKCSRATSSLGPDTNKSGSSSPLTKETLHGSNVPDSAACGPSVSQLPPVLGGTNIRAQPFLLREGDILVVADVNDEMYKDDLLMSSAMSVVANGGWGGANANIGGSFVSNTSTGPNGKPNSSNSAGAGAEGHRVKSQRQRRPEAALRIRMDEYEE